MGEALTPVEASPTVRREIVASFMATVDRSDVVMVRDAEEADLEILLRAGEQLYIFHLDTHTYHMQSNAINVKDRDQASLFHLNHASHSNGLRRDELLYLAES